MCSCFVPLSLKQELIEDVQGEGREQLPTENRITEYPRLEGPIRIRESKSRVGRRQPQDDTLRPRALSEHSLSSLRLRAATTSLGSPCQCPNTLWAKNRFLVPKIQTNFPLTQLQAVAHAALAEPC